MTDCDRCQESRDMGYDFCRWCGNRLGPSGYVRNGMLLNIGLVIVLVSVVMLIIETVIAILMFPEVLPKLGDASTGILLLLPLPVVAVTISGALLQTYYVVLFIALIASIILLFYKFVGPMRDLLTKKDADGVQNSALFEMAVLFASVYVIQFAFILLLMLMGVPMDSPLDTSDDAHWKNAFLLLEASVWEEVITRVMFIGLPMLIIALLLRYGGRSYNEDVRPHRHLIGGFGIDRISVLFILLSAFIFGAAHVPGWGAWKFFPSFIVGLALGYLFVKHGLFAAIGMHFFFDYLLSLDWMMDNGDTLMVMPILLIAILGIPYVWVYAKRGLSYITGMFSQQD